MGDSQTLSYADAATRLGMSVPAVTSAIYRLRERFRQVFHEEIANTLDNPQNTEDEIRQLLAALGG
jgi:RNA polymerase sigma-70 factor (ECF subfamily)